MAATRNYKIALLAATAFAASAGAVAPSAPTAPTIEANSPNVMVHVADEPSALQAAPLVKNVAIAAAITGALAALYRMVGGARLRSFFNKAGPATAKAARTVAAAPMKAAKAVGRAASSPFRFLMIILGLGLFALTGFGLFDLEWAGGLMAGAAGVAIMWFGAAKTRRVFARKPQSKPARR